MNHNYQNKSFRLRLLLLPVVFAFAALVPFVSPAQVLQVESFESTIFPAPGWKQFKALSAATGAFARQQVSTATQPGAPGIAQATGGGPFMMMFNSASAPANDTSFMISKPFDFSAAGASTPTFSFQMYRDNNFTSNNDQILVYVNTTPTFTGATPVNHGGGVNFINRPFSSYPAVAANTWQTYTFTVPAAFVNSPKKTYIIVVGKSAAGYNMYIDDFRVNTYPSPAFVGDVELSVVQQNFASVGLGATNQWIIGVRCVLGGTSGCGNVALGTAVKLDSLLFNTNGTNNVNDIQNVKVWYTGGSQQFSTAYVSPFPTLAGNRYPTAQYGTTIAVPATNIDFFNTAAGCFHLEYDTSYFWLSYDIKPTATGGNFVDGDFREGWVTPGGLGCPTPGGNPSTIVVNPDVSEIPGGPQIDIPYCVPTYTVGTKWANYTNNDYVQRVEFLSAVAPTFINTYVNSVSVQDPAAPGYPNCPFAGHPPDYELWPSTSGKTVILTQGQTYNFRAQCGTWFSANYIQAWIDYNRNGLFEASEKCVATPSSLTSNQWQNFSTTVPAAGYTGTTRMRVREVFATSNIDPCNNYTYGECEDFNITILPNCPVGYKLWLGNTSNWADPSNWCGGVPTSADSAVINKSAPQVATVTRRYFHPIVMSGTKANTRGLYVSPLDTLMIDAPNPADTALRVHGGLHQNGKFIVKGGYQNTVVISNGAIVNNIYTPFRGSSVADARCQIMYSAAELLAQGLVANDKITQIGFNITAKNSAGPFNGFTISYGFQPAGTVQFASNAPLPTPTTVYGPIAYVTALGANLITLTTPIVWDGTSALVIQYCFDNAASIFGNDLINITQTTGRKTVLLLTSSTVSPGCSLIPGAGVSDNFFTSAGINRPNFAFYIDRTYGKPLIGLKGDWNNNGTFIPANSRVVMDSSGVQNIQGTNPTTFHELNISKALAPVGPITNTSANSVILQRPLTIEDTLLMTRGALVMNKQTILIQNQKPVSGSAATSFSGPVTRPASGGIIISEDTLSKFTWDVGTWKGPGTTRDYYAIPFGSINAVYIPFSFGLSDGNLGLFTVSTYGTAAVNTPYPPTVHYVGNPAGVNNAITNVVDRFWVTTKTGTNPRLDMSFRYAPTERPTTLFNGLSNPGRVFPWRVSSNNMGAWLRLFSQGTTPPTLATAVPFTMNYSVADSVQIIQFDWPNVLAGGAPFNATAGPMPNTTPWSIAGISANALPVELLNFDAVQVGPKVKVYWNTATEINNDYFIVERSDKDQSAFEYVAKVRSWFNNSTVPLYYEAFDDRPLEGLSYYRLKQVDIDGQVTYSDPVAVYYDPSRVAQLPFDIVNTYADQLSSGNVVVEFSYDNEMPLNYTITDATGRTVAAGTGIAAQPGLNRITLNQPLTRGMYIVTLQNDEKAVSRRFVY